MIENLPRKCFISHAYADKEACERLVNNLPAHIKPIIFPPIKVKPNQFVSNKLIKALRKCGGLIYLSGGASDLSFWVAFERDYALRTGKKVFSADIQYLKIQEDVGPALDLAAYASYSRKDHNAVRRIVDYLNKKRNFDIWLDINSLKPGGDYALQVEQSLKDRLSRGYVVVFWSRAASESKYIQDEIEKASENIDKINDRVIFALLENVDIPDFWKQYQDPAVQLFGDNERSQNQRLDDLMVRLYWLIYKKTHTIW